jgi:Flp pilus assembly protein TadG
MERTMRSTDVRARTARVRAITRFLAADERGAILALVTLMGLVILGLTGLVVDMGLAYVAKAQMSRAVDAGSLAGARTLRRGQDVAEDQALALAEVNGASAATGALVDVQFGTNAEGEATVQLSASRVMPTIFLRAMGVNELPISSAAVAAVPPVDMTLVLDQSGSLATNGAWDDLQAASKAFVEQFDDDIDQMSLVSFALRAANRFNIGHDFTTAIKNQINAMTSAGDTNASEGLRYAYLQMQSGAIRERSVKVVVFFTDGRPTAFRGVLGDAGPAGGGNPMGPFNPVGAAVDRIMAVYTTGNQVRGYFNNPDALPINSIPNPNGCQNVATCFGTWNEAGIRTRSRENSLTVADAIRNQGIYIYSIGLGDPMAGPLLAPDLPYLRAIANEDGVSNPDQPQGRMYFAPSEEDLAAVFNQVAQDLLVRLAR